jgi:hypothetical protein
MKTYQIHLVWLENSAVAAVTAVLQIVHAPQYFVMELMLVSALVPKSPRMV